MARLVNDIKSTEQAEQYESTWVDRGMQHISENRDFYRGVGTALAASQGETLDPEIEIPNTGKDPLQAAEVRSVEEFQSLSHLHGDGGESNDGEWKPKVSGVEFDL